MLDAISIALKAHIGEPDKVFGHVLGALDAQPVYLER